MGRGRREKIQNKSNIRYLFYLSLGVLLIMIITFIIVYNVYRNKIKKSISSELTTEKIAELVPNNEQYKSIEETSINIGKSIEDVVKDVEKNTITKEVQNNIEEKQEEKNEIVKADEEINVINQEIEKIKDPEFSMPVEGDIFRNYAKDTLIYSDTLQEWITHFGIDIKAPRTTIVKASEAGEIIGIKNDPRYGLTIIIEHVNGFKSIYSNLLTTEFVSEGDKVEKGQSIGTVGNSASFEIVDEPHLHFEILKDEINVDPNIYLK